MTTSIPTPNDGGTTPHEPFPVCVLGLGLIGGSLLRDLADAGWPAFGWNRSASTVEDATAAGYDASADLAATLRRAESAGALIVLGVPVPALPSLLDAIQLHSPSLGFTDVTSVKGEVHDLVEERGMSDRFVGGHPMAGTAESGWSATLAGLFRTAVWVVTYDQVAGGVSQVGAAGGAGAAQLNPLWLQTFTRVVQLAETVGAVVIPSRARRHDSAVARISHLPHVFAETLAITGDQGGPLSLALAASSFRDMTRVAGTAPGLVRAMCENNRETLLKALDESLELLTAARDSLADPSGDLADLTELGFAAHHRYRSRDAAGQKHVLDAMHGAHPVIRVRPGAKGWVDQLRSAESIGARIAIF